MDLQKTIQDLHREKESIERAITAIEELRGVVTDAALKTKCRSATKLLKPRSSEDSPENQAGEGRAT